MARLYSQPTKFNWRRAAPFAGGAAAIGAVVVAISLAAGPIAAFEPELGAMSGGATSVTQSGASGGKALQFNATPTPTPTPTISPSQTLNCAPAKADTMTNTVSHLCGFADTTNTGVPAGTTLQTVPGQVTRGNGWHWTGGYVAIDGEDASGNKLPAGTPITFSGFIVTSGNIDVTVSNVTISNNQLTLKGDQWAIGLRNTKNVTIQNNTISSPVATGPDRLQEGIRDIFGTSDDVKIVGNNIFHADTCINHFDQGGLIERNYCHDMGINGDDHINGIQLGSGEGPLMTIRHNTILNQIQQSDCIMLATDDGPQTNRIIDHNLIAGGGYSLYGNGGPSTVSTQIRVTNNHFSKLFYPNGGYFGAVAYFTYSTGNVWTNNVWDDTGAPVNP